MKVAPGALAAVLLVAACTSTPTNPSALRPDQPKAGAGTDQRTWLAAEDWEGFTRTTLWPQERALRYWHIFRISEGRIDLTPAHPLPPAPVPRASDTGGDPRIWKVDWKEPGTAPSLSRTKTEETEFRVTEVAGLPPSLYGLRIILQSIGATAGRVRVIETEMKSGRFTVKIEWE